MKKFRKAAAAFFGMTFVLSAALCGCAGGGESSKQSSAVQQSDNTNDEAYKAAQEGGIKAAGADPEAIGKVRSVPASSEVATACATAASP